MRRFQNDSPYLPTVTMLLLMSFAGLPGCGASDAITMPTYAPAKAAELALAEYDTNKDGFLDAKELERCPALKSSLEFMDKDGDKRLSAEEIRARVQVYADSQVGLKSVGCRVYLDGRPLEGATVTYTPEKFMGSAIKSASGVSDARGGVALTALGEKTPGVQPGFYRVQISKQNAGGQETIPARYNQDTTLGIEIYPTKKRRAGPEDDYGQFKLSSKSK